MTSLTDTASTPSLPWKARQAIKLIAIFMDSTHNKDATLKSRMIKLFDFQAPPNSKPLLSVTTTDITVDPTRNLWFRLFSPTVEHSLLPLFIYFHGGGFTSFSPATKAYDVLCRRFAKNVPAYVLSVNYRLAPEFNFPAPSHDGIDILNFLDDPNNHSLLPKKVDLSRCFLAGDSAGANLAHHVAIRACRAKFRTLKVAGLVSIQPFFGGEERTEAEKRLVHRPSLASVVQCDALIKAFLPEGANRDHAAINVSGPNAEDISGLNYPATLLFVGGFDELQDWQKRYYEWLKKSGKNVTLIEYPNMIHAFYIFAYVPESGQLIAKVKEFVAKRQCKL